MQARDTEYDAYDRAVRHSAAIEAAHDRQDRERKTVGGDALPLDRCRLTLKRCRHLCGLIDLDTIGLQSDQLTPGGVAAAIDRIEERAHGIIAAVRLLPRMPANSDVAIITGAAA